MATRNPRNFIVFSNIFSFFLQLKGPRNCIAIRFALLEMKILLAALLSKLNFIKCNETEVSIKMKLNEKLEWHV